MAEQSGEAKYILKALAPAITRAKSNFQASMAAQHPMFDRDVNAMEVDWDKILGGGSHKMIGSISGRKGDLIRIPMRLLTATDDFNRTLLACCEVGTFAYRIAKAKGMKPGSPEMDKFIRVEVNTPGSFSYQLASKKASSAIYSNPLPGQKDPHTGKPVQHHPQGHPPHAESVFALRHRPGHRPEQPRCQPGRHDEVGVERARPQSGAHRTRRPAAPRRDSHDIARRCRRGRG
jgi:hypothetical protein